MSKKIASLALLFSAFGLTACQDTASPTTTVVHNTTSQETPSVIAEVNQLTTLPTTERNSAKLIQEAGFCLIEFTGYFPKAKVTEHWALEKLHPVSATITIEHFQDEALTQATASHSDPLDHTAPERLANLEKLKQYFKTKDLERCQTT